MEGNYQVNDVVYKYDLKRGRMGVLFLQPQAII